MDDRFILRKDVDWSVLYNGFTIPVYMQSVVALNLSHGVLSHGEKRTVTVMFCGNEYNVTMRSVNFNREVYPDHKDIWQIVYGKESSIAKAFRNTFIQSHNELFALRQNRDNKRNSKLLTVSDDIKEYRVLYATDIKDVFCLEPIFNHEIPHLEAVQDEMSLENMFDIPSLMDKDASIIEEYHLTKVRKLNRSIGNYLKELYGFRCQICGLKIGEIYGANVIECHHIKYFTQSLNNDITNLLILCPNHHRVIHSKNPHFDEDNKRYIYPNGYIEGLALNIHLR